MDAGASAEIGRLREELRERDGRLLTRDAEVATLHEALHAAQRDNAFLRARLKAYLRRAYGSSSEKVVAGQLELDLGEILDAVDDAPAPAAPEPPENVPDEESAREKTKEQRRKGGHGRGPLPAHLRRERVLHELPEDERACPCCGKTMAAFAESVTEEVEYVPAHFVVLEHVRPKYSCRDCQEGVAQADLPPRPVEKGRPGPGLLAHVVVSKYKDHLPLNRQCGILARHGISIAISTLCDWIAAVADALHPVVAEIGRVVRAGRIVGADETPVVVLDGDDGRRRRQCWFFVYRGEDGDVVYDFRPTRARDGPEEFLKDYRGYLQRDAYTGYGNLDKGIVHVGCMAHARRGFHEALATEPEQAALAIALIRRLYAVEREAQERMLARPDIAALRRERSVPVLDALRQKLGEWQATALPKSPLGKAVGYAQRQWETLVRYVGDGIVPIDNNATERALRGVACGRKNWLFAGSLAGGKRAATIYSVIESCKAAEVDALAYLKDVLVRVATTPASRIAELTPRGWKAARGMGGS